MRKKFLLSVILLLCLFISSGCENKEKDSVKTNSKDVLEKIENCDLDELKTIVKDNIKKTEELEKELENSKKEKEELIQTITDLENQLTELKNTTNNINNTIEAKYNELKGLIASSITNVSKTNNYTISKNQLIGTWKDLNSSSVLIFTNDNCQVLGNWVIYNYNNSEMAFAYIYKDGKLYISEAGSTLIKQ